MFSLLGLNLWRLFMYKTLLFLFLINLCVINLFAEEKITVNQVSGEEILKKSEKNAAIILIKQDVVKLISRVEAVETQYSSTQGDLKNNLGDIRKKLADLRMNLEAHINQKCQELAEEQQKILTEFRELQQVIIKYGNNPDSMSTLHYAIKMGDVNAVNLLIANGADVNSTCLDCRSPRTITALSRAAIYNQLEIARILLNSGADVNFAPFDDCYYPIYYSAEFGSADLVTLLIENGAKLNSVKPIPELNGIPIRTPETPLHIAAKTGNYDIVVALVNEGAPIDGNIRNPQGGCEGTPLEWAANNLKYSENPQNLELVRFLVDHGATRWQIKYHENEFCRNMCPVISGYLKGIGR